MDVERAKSRSGNERSAAYDLRHPFGSWLIERGAAPSVVRDLMGHCSLAVTSRYVQAAPEGRVRPIRSISARGWPGAGKRGREVSEREERYG